MKVGANYLGSGRCEFVVWPPFSNDMSLKLATPSERIMPMEMDNMGYWQVTADGILPCMCYFYMLDHCCPK